MLWQYNKKAGVFTRLFDTLYKENTKSLLFRCGAADTRLVSHTRSDYCVFASLTRRHTTRSLVPNQSPVLVTKSAWLGKRRFIGY
jgi:hypothetical protein